MPTTPTHCAPPNATAPNTTVRKIVVRKIAALLVVAVVAVAGTQAPPAYAEQPRRPTTSTAESETRDSVRLITELLRRLPSPRRPWAGMRPTAGGSAQTRRTHPLGATRSGLPWHSGVWVGGRFTPAGLEAFETMRGRKVDLVTTYGYAESPDQLSGDEWPITTWDGFRGRLNYGLPLAFRDGAGMDAVAAGRVDEHYRGVARSLVKHGRSDSVVRAGWEFNYQAWPWGTNSKNVDTFKKAFRRAVTVMRAEAPQLRFEFGINCGDGLAGASDRLAPLTMGYPGDDVVDIVGCDTYDRWSGHAADKASWQRVLRGEQGPGIEDVTDFARRHRKRAGFGEWGLAKSDGKNNGGGDNPFYVSAMYRFFEQNSDVIAFECYFDEADEEMANSLVLNQMPRSREAYAARWGKRS